MRKNGSGLMVVIGVSCLAAAWAMIHASRVLAPPFGVAGQWGVLSFALAVLIEIEA